MRVLRPVLLLAVLCGLAAATHSQGPRGGNRLSWGRGFPSPLDGGVAVVVTGAPGNGWDFTDLTVRVIDDATNKTLAEDNHPSPAAIVMKDYAGLGGGLTVRVTAMATFQKGADFDFLDLETTVTTK
jgi:hypothetical protein